MMSHNSGPTLIGRETERDLLRRALDGSRTGERRIVFVSGEPGIGKTTLVDALAAEAAAQGVPMARGQCFEHFGPGEPYLPMLDALEDLGRGDGRSNVIDVLLRLAPSWLTQLPGLLDESQHAKLALSLAGTTPVRMLREIAAALDRLSEPDGLLLILEDLHWADLSTVELLSYFASARRGSRVLVVGTFRPTELVLHDHALKRIKQELLARRCAEEIALEFFGPSDVGAFMEQALPGLGERLDLVDVVHRRTEGNPLFVGEVLSDLVAQNLVSGRNGRWRFDGPIEAVGTVIPLGLRELIDKHVSALPAEERRVLEAASVVGAEVTGVAVAAAADEMPAKVEDVLERLAREGRFVASSGLHTWPDASVSGSYRFRHALYQASLYSSIAPARRAECHRRIGEREAAAWGERAREHAAELAVHFERGQDLERAAAFLETAGETALGRHAYVEARDHFERGLGFLETVAASPTRDSIELGLLMGLAVSLRVLDGYAVERVLAAHDRAASLADRVGDVERGFHARYGRCEGITIAGRLDEARPLAEELLAEAERLARPSLEMQARYTLGEICVFAGSLAEGRRHLERSADLYDPEAHVGRWRPDKTRAWRAGRTSVRPSGSSACPTPPSSAARRPSRLLGRVRARSTSAMRSPSRPSFTTCVASSQRFARVSGR